MKLIPLTQGKFAQVDDEDFEYLNQWKWYAHKEGKSVYVQRKSMDEKGKRVNIRMHRLILGLTDPKVFGEHKDHNGLNNQRGNLRLATNAQNQCNKRKQGIYSKYLGVSRHISKSGDWSKTYWGVSLQSNGKSVLHKNFPFTPEGEISAAKAYDEAAKLHHGEFANLNFK